MKETEVNKLGVIIYDKIISIKIYELDLQDQHRVYYKVLFHFPNCY